MCVEHNNVGFSAPWWPLWSSDHISLQNIGGQCMAQHPSALAYTHATLKS
jgi:hypothetical protein